MALLNDGNTGTSEVHEHNMMTMRVKNNIPIHVEELEILITFTTLFAEESVLFYRCVAIY